MTTDVVLSMKNITLTGGDVPHLRNLNFSLREAEIHAIVGEHGSGKSTFVRFLSGLGGRYEGDLSIFQTPYPSFSPAQSLQCGIGIVHQKVQLVRTLSALENIFIGRYILQANHVINFKRMRRQMEEFLEERAIELDIRKPIASLSSQDRSKVQLLKAMYFNPRIAIFDEISSFFNQDEIELTYRFMQEMVQDNRSVIYISNNMKEIFEFADRVSIIRSGTIIKTEEIAKMDKVRLVDLTYSFASTRDELRKSNVELYNFKKYNEDIIDNLPVGVVILDSEQRLYLANHAAETICSHSPEVPFTLNALFNHIDEEIREQLQSVMAQHLMMTWNEISLPENRFGKLTVFPFKDDNYRFLGTILLLEDISQEINFKTYLLQAERVSSIAELAAGVAHEINNPLSIILNYVELLSRRASDEYSREKLGKIESELNRIHATISSMLSFSHPNDQPREVFDLASLVEETLVLLGHKFKKKHVLLQFDKPNVPIILYGNENQLKQVVINLVVNAFDAVDEAGTIEVVLSTTSNYAEIRVIDNGRGFDSEALSRMFTPFFTTKIDKHNTGLGLTICQHIIESHMGLIDCTREGGRTIFRIRLPLEEGTEDES